MKLSPKVEKEIRIAHEKGIYECFVTITNELIDDQEWIKDLQACGFIVKTYGFEYLISWGEYYRPTYNCEYFDLYEKTYNYG